MAAYLKAINYYENSPTTSTLYGRYGNTAKELSAIYADLNEYQLEEKYSKQFLLLASKQNDPNLIFDAYMRMGYMFEQKYVQNPSDKQFRNKKQNNIMCRQSRRLTRIKGLCLIRAIFLMQPLI